MSTRRCPRIAQRLLTTSLLAGLALAATAPVVAAQQLRAHQSTYVVRLAGVPDLDGAPVLLRQPVTLRQERITVERALREISRQAGVTFAYSRAVVPLDRIVSIDVENGSVLEALHVVLAGVDVELWISPEGRMALVPAAPDLPAPPASERVGTITGRVIAAATSEPLAAVTVTVAGTSLGTTTGDDGRYTIRNVPDGPRTVYAQRLGFRRDSVVVVITDRATAIADFALERQAVTLEGVVTIGYGTQEAERVTGAVASVTPAEFNTGRVVSAEELIQGKVPGVQVANTGEPGGGTNIRIRGATSVNASNEPLFVVDGVPLAAGGGLSAGRNPLNFLNPDDIQNITVLKDASATAIYGSRGANGVILIETKSGGMAAPAFEYTGSVSSSDVIADPEFLTADQFRAAVTQHAPGRATYLGTANTDWRSAVLRDAFGQEHNLAVTGSGDVMNYRLSLGYLEQGGVVIGSQTERLSAALNYQHRLFADRLAIAAGLRGARTDDLFTPGGGIGAATIFDPTQPIRVGSEFFEQRAFALSPTNPLADATFGSVEGTTYRAIGNLEARYRMPMLEGLIGTLRLGTDIAASERREFFPTTLWGQERTATPGFLNRSNPRETTSLLDAFLTYGSRLDQYRSDVDATAGYSFETSRGDYPYFELRGLGSDLLGPNGVPSAEESLSRLSVSERKLASFFGRVNWTLQDRYTLMLSVRRDGSSRFGPANQWGTFPAAAIAWRLGDEDFMRGVGFFNDLKLRASWGVNGNQAIGDYLWVPDYRYGDDLSRVQFGDDFVTTLRPNAVDPNIKWEETTSWNLGADFALLGGRLGGTLDYYVKDTDDLLFRVPVAAGTFVSNYVTTNIGSMRNTGFELGLDVAVVPAGRGGFSWDADFTAAHNRNRLTRINAFSSGTEQILTGGISGGVGSNIQVLQPGYPIYSFFVYRHRRDANGEPVLTGTDMQMYVDQNGDDQINQSDRVPFEDPAPDWTLGHSSRFAYGNFDLSYTLRALLGNYVYNNVASSQGFYDRLNEAAGPVNLHASVLEFGFQRPQYFSELYVEDASFLRLDNITLGVALPNLRGVQRARLFGTIQNAFTISGYSGVDPAAGLNGIDNFIYPRSRTFSAGLTLGF